MKQQRVNTFLRDLGEFVEKYYSEGITDVQYEEYDGWVKVIIVGDNETRLELRSLISLVK